ncbi:hypothetical protein [Sphingopyxis sp. GW247-27LB]|uniref:hypothetical protein n=1 Tax=Sphingopyxis sp. GW247-27LB TaxID=2012632 RepID=UPI000BA79D81|nr:hypothetical protein [Sphingopyxis sp. GW247-27LB]PAL22660.1 hypothetical protein CD928_11405 [Sphingopyxis sp. GW247-27LB]
MIASGWLGAGEFAAVMNITRRAATDALKAMAKGKPWRGELFTVRTAHGRGGASGSTYQVYLGDPSEADETALIPISFTPAPAAASNQAARIERRLMIISEAAKYPRGSAERAAELERASRQFGKPIRTLRTWLANAEKHGWDANALAYKRPSNSGEQRVFVSRPFDRAWRAAGLDDAALADMGEWVTRLINGLWQSEAQRAGWGRIQLEAHTLMQLECRKRDIALPKAAFHLSKRRIVERSHHRIVDIYANDRKRADDWKHRITRNNRLLMPMDQVVMDVKPLDIVMSRPDGSEVWPTMIGFQDNATHRIFYHFVMKRKGEGITQEHVIGAFIDMVMHPEWGFPRQLYRDNGSEFFAFDRLRECMAEIALDGVKPIINAKAYSGASKQIESKFAILDRQVFSQMLGYAGSNRMVKKTQTVGKPPARYPGSFEEFVAEAELRIADWHGMTIKSGPFKGTSPAQCFADHVDSGWRPITADPFALDLAFHQREARTVQNGFVSVGGVKWRHPELPLRRKVEIARPYRRGAAPLVNLPGLGWAAMQHDEFWHPQEIGGAEASSRVQCAQVRGVKALRKDAIVPDLAAAMRERVTRLPRATTPNPVIEFLTAQDAPKFEGDRIGPAPRALSAEEENVRRQNAKLRQMEKYRANRA